MKKRFLSLGLAAVMAMSLTACGGSNTAETTKAAETTAADAKAEGVRQQIPLRQAACSKLAASAL